MKQQQFIQQQVKNIFKVSKQLYSTFRGIKKLTMKYLIKITKLKNKKNIYDHQRQIIRKKQQIQKRKLHKLQSKKHQQQLQNQQNNTLQQNTNLNSDNIVPHKSIITILNDNKQKLKSNRPKQQPQLTQQKPPNPKQPIKQSSTTKPKQKPPQQKKKPQKPTKPQKPAQQPAKTTKILHKPIQPQSPYYRFLRMKKNQIRSSMNNIPMEKTTQIMKSIWDKMRDDQKRQYIQSYQIDKAKYQRDSAAYFNQQNYKNTAKKDQPDISNPNQPISAFDFIDQLDKM